MVTVTGAAVVAVGSTVATGVAVAHADITKAARINTVSIVQNFLIIFSPFYLYIYFFVILGID
jgi:hypothetical protein